MQCPALLLGLLEDNWQGTGFYLTISEVIGLLKVAVNSVIFTSFYFRPSIKGAAGRFPVLQVLTAPALDAPPASVGLLWFQPFSSIPSCRPPCLTTLSVCFLVCPELTVLLNLRFLPRSFQLGWTVDKREG